MKKILISTVTLLLALILFYSFNSFSNQDHPEQYKIIGYVFGSNMDKDPSGIEAEKLTHINYAFANIIEGKITEGDPRDTERLKHLNDLKKRNEDLQILVSVGGWSWSGGFSDAVLTNSSREVFANSAISFLQKHELDGIDLDWEYPGMIGAGNTFRPEDKQNFTLILQRIRSKMDSLTAITNKEYLLTIASATTSEYMRNVEMEKIHQYLDFINIMTYDFHGEWGDKASHHTNLFPSESDPVEFKQSAVAGVEAHQKAGVPIEKLVLGVAFYGRGWQNVPEYNNGLHQSGEKGFSLNYKDIVDSINTKNFTRLWDESARAPYLWNPATSTFITYDDPRSLKEKAEFIKEQGMGGAMFWQYHADNGNLLNVLAEELLKSPRN